MGKCANCTNLQMFAIFSRCKCAFIRDSVRYLGVSIIHFYMGIRESSFVNAAYQRTAGFSIS